MKANNTLAPVMLDLMGVELAEVEREIIQHPLVGGIVLFSRNYESVDQLKSLIFEIRKIRKPLLIAVDQEGGRVQRFRDGFTPLPAFSTFGGFYNNDPEAAKKQAKESAKIMARELIEVGIDFSFSPVLDIDRGKNTVIGDRSFGENPDKVAALGQSYIEGMHEMGMRACGKHFPGHGYVSDDSHETLPFDERKFEEINATDLLPFRHLSRFLDAIMVAHIVYKEIDSKPAGFSHYWLQEILRKQLQFDGVIFSDDLSMKGADIMGDMLSRTKAALEAGCDKVLICNDQKAAISVLDSLK